MRFAILARDPVCRWGTIQSLWSETGLCNQDATEVDHIGAAWDNDPSVLRGICHYHHLRRTSMQANAAKQLLRSLMLRPAEKHPGYKITTDKGTAEGTAFAADVVINDD